MRSVFLAKVTIKDKKWDVEAAIDALSGICEVVDGDDENLYCEVPAVWDEDERGAYSNPAVDEWDFCRVLDNVVDDYRVDVGSYTYDYI